MARTKVERQDPREPSPALYVNYFEMGHNPFEFLIDLGQLHLCGRDEAAIAIHTRIAITPPYAKMLSELLTRSVRDHESEHGPIASVGHSPFDSVLSSLDEFEARARSLREHTLVPSDSHR